MPHCLRFRFRSSSDSLRISTIKTLGCSALANPKLQMEVARSDYHIVIELIEFSWLPVDILQVFSTDWSLSIYLDLWRLGSFWAVSAWTPCIRAWFLHQKYGFNIGAINCHYPLYQANIKPFLFLVGVALGGGFACVTKMARSWARSSGVRGQIFSVPWQWFVQSPVDAKRQIHLHIAPVAHQITQPADVHLEHRGVTCSCRHLSLRPTLRFFNSETAVFVAWNSDPNFKKPLKRARTL